VIEVFPYEQFAEEAVSGQVPAGEVARKVQSLAWEGHISGAAHMARAWFGRLPGSQYIRRVMAWYVSRHSGYRLLPFRKGEGFDAAVDEWNPSDEVFRRLRAEYEAVCRDGARERGSLLVMYQVLGPHGRGDLEKVVERVQKAVGRAARGDLWYTAMPLPPEGELGEFDA